MNDKIPGMCLDADPINPYEKRIRELEARLAQSEARIAQLEAQKSSYLTYPHNQGYNCGNCGCWVTHGQPHACYYYNPNQTVHFSYTQPTFTTVTDTVDSCTTIAMS